MPLELTIDGDLHWAAHRVGVVADRAAVIPWLQVLRSTELEEWLSEQTISVNQVFCGQDWGRRVEDSLSISEPADAHGTVVRV